MSRVWATYSTSSVGEPEAVGAGTFWFGAGAGIKARLPAPGSGSILDKTEKILNNILFVHSHID